jgi:4,4'-diaponeurosporenoate glycosyltransferase
VIVPARNEAASLPQLLTSVAATTRVPHDVLVVDDGSTDATVDVARKYGATVVDAGPPPPGWAGKPWACQQGANRATGTHLLFLDADTWLAPDAIDRLLGEHEQHGGLVSVQPYHVTHRAYEQLSAFCNAVAMMGTGAFSASKPSSTKAAFGPCVFTSTADYRAAGGHASVGGAVIEDVQLARRYRARGLPVTCFGGGGLVQFRMYPDGVAQLIEGWSKNLASGAAAVDPIAVAGAVVWIGAGLASARSAASACIRFVRDGKTVPTRELLAYALFALETQLILRKVGRFQPWTAVAFPVPLTAFVVLFARSVFLTYVRREVLWRGRRLPTRMRSRDRH